MRARSWIVSLIGAVSGVCFAVLAARSLGVLAIAPGFRISALVCAIITACLSYVAFRAAISGRPDRESFFQALAGGVGGALVAVVIILGGYAFFRQATRAYFAHPVGLKFSQLTMTRLIAALLWLGFAAGFALRIPRLQKEEQDQQRPD